MTTPLHIDPVYVPMSGAGYVREVRIDRVPIGTRVMNYMNYSDLGCHCPDEYYLGTVLWLGNGSVEVIWDGCRDSIRVCCDLPVWIVDEELIPWDLEEQLNAEHISREPDTEARAQMTIASASAPQVAALRARYEFQLKALQTALEDDDKAKAQVTMIRIDKCLAEAQQIRVKLADPADSIRAYTPLAESIARYSTVPKPPEEQSGADKTVARAVALEKHNNESKATKTRSAGATASKPKTDKKQRPCLDGCGALVNGNFAMGHDAKLKSLLHKVERGEVPIDAIPEIVVDLIKITKGELTIERDSEGKPKREVQTYVITAAPVRFPNRPEIVLTQRED